MTAALCASLHENLAILFAYFFFISIFIIFYK
jgi:hypothetical protein